MGVAIERLRSALHAANPRTAYVRSGVLVVSLLVFAALQWTFFRARGTVEPLAVLLELSIVAAAIGGVVAFDFLRTAPAIYRPMVAGLSLVGLSATDGVMAHVVFEPLWVDLVFENAAFLVAIGAFAVAAGRWSDRHAEQERELKRRNERLEEFATVVSHDLRNPLQVAKLRATAAREDGDEEHFAHLDRSLDRIEAIVTDVLELARVGAESAEPGVLQLSSVATEAWHGVEGGDATMTVESDGTIGADPALLQQALENLFRNAVEHGGTGVAITVGVDGHTLYVADDGPGIPPGERDRVLDSGYSTATDGTGFGLAIVQTIAEAHGWEIDVRSSESGGARFELGPIDEFSRRR